MAKRWDTMTADELYTLFEQECKGIGREMVLGFSYKHYLDRAKRLYELYWAAHTREWEEGRS